MFVVKRFFRRVKRVMDFLPMIWKGYDYDYRYAIELFQYQLERTAEMMESDQAMTVDADIRARRIRTAVELLQKVYDEEYGCEYQDKLKEMYGENVLDWWFEDTGEGDGSSYLRLEYEKWDNADEVAEVKHKLYDESKAKQKRAEELVWKFISHNIRYWWD
jgi:hypothetical protein